MSVFQFRGPLQPDSPLYKGRQTDLEKLVRWCKGEVQHYGIIFGARQSGKSSLLLRLEQRLSSSHVVCHADFEYLSEASPARVFGALAQDFARAFSQTVPNSEIPDALCFSEYLCQLLEVHPAQQVVLLIEELGALPKTSRFALANALRAIFNDRQRTNRRALARLMVIVAGNTELYDLAYTDVSPFANICESHYLVDLSESEALGLVQDGLSTLDVPLDVSAQMGSSIYKLVHGYTYLTQRLGHALEAELENGAPLNDEVLEQAVADLIICGDPLVSHLQKALLEQDLMPIAKSVLNEKIRFNRHEEGLARLELAGFIRPENGFWYVRNPLFACAVQNWLADSERMEQSALHRGLVRVLNWQGDPVGAGFLVDHNRVITCAHVLDSVFGMRDRAVINGEVTVDFPLLNMNMKFKTRIAHLQPYEAGTLNDIAIIELISEIPADTNPLSFGKKPAQWGKSFRVCGFPRGREDGAWSTGVLRGPISDGRIQLEDTKSTGYSILPGFSGSPVWDEFAGGVIGMIVAADTDKDIKAAFMIPSNELQKILKPQISKEL